MSMCACACARCLRVILIVGAIRHRMVILSSTTKHQHWAISFYLFICFLGCMCLEGVDAFDFSSLFLRYVRLPYLFCPSGIASTEVIDVRSRTRQGGGRVVWIALISCLPSAPRLFWIVSIVKKRSQLTSTQTHTHFPIKIPHYLPITTTHPQTMNNSGGSRKGRGAPMLMFGC